MKPPPTFLTIIILFISFNVFGQKEQREMPIIQGEDTLRGVIDSTELGYGSDQYIFSDSGTLIIKRDGCGEEDVNGLKRYGKLDSTLKVGDTIGFYSYTDAVYRFPQYIPKYDTVEVIVQYVDTSLKELTAWQNGYQYWYKDYDYSIKWMRVYSVRKSDMMWDKEYFYHDHYLDANKKKLPKGIIVFMGKEL